MHAYKAVLSIFLSMFALAGSAMAAGSATAPGKPSMASTTSVADRSEHFATFEMSLSKASDKAGEAPVELQHVTLAAAMRKSAFMSSLTQTNYACQDEANKLTTCSLEYGTLFQVVPRPVDAGSARLVADVEMTNSELTKFVSVQSPAGTVERPIVQRTHLYQEVVLSPGEDTRIVSGQYTLTVRLKSVN